ncbi:GNAT family N-acetyltransferase [Halalkalibacillus halophilus]|uniref:GNAT family N-acetyltransferase n=1 Tax=Halalkalibacillus halophilus TaxID=392827 RepID=UPI00040E3AC7|nr:GNAT family N-acetyltransferase [Halalkalibacillus halophilus]
MQVRKAKHEEVDLLSEIAMKSKAYWGYSKDFLHKCNDELTVTKDSIDHNFVYVIEKDRKLIGFYNLSINQKELDALFIAPDFIGKGVGRVLWSDLIEKAKESNLKDFTIESDPEAAGFYVKMGAEKIGYTNSTVFPGRSLPVFKMKII